MFNHCIVVDFLYNPGMYIFICSNFNENIDYIRPQKNYYAVKHLCPLFYFEKDENSFGKERFYFRDAADVNFITLKFKK